VTRDCVTVATGKSKSYGKNRDSESQIQRLVDPRCGQTLVSRRHASRKLRAMAHTRIFHAVHCVTPIVRRDNYFLPRFVTSHAFQLRNQAFCFSNVKIS